MKVNAERKYLQILRKRFTVFKFIRVEWKVILSETRGNSPKRWLLTDAKTEIQTKADSNESATFMSRNHTVCHKTKKVQPIPYLFFA